MVTLLLMAASPLAVAEQTLTLGILAFRPDQEIQKRWEPLADYLTGALPGNTVRLAIMSFSDLEESLHRREIDFILTNPSHYMQARKNKELSGVMATLVEMENSMPLTSLGGLIFSLKERSDLSQLSHLAGKTVAITNKASLGGYQAQAYELIHAGVNPDEDLRLIQTGMPHDLVMNAVLAGEADAGFVRTGILEAMVREGKIDPAWINVINLQHPADFPLATSTRLYPQWPFAALAHVDQNLTRKMAAALLSFEARRLTDGSAETFGFTIPADYSEVENLLRALRLPPFEGLPAFSLRDIWARYRYTIIALSAMGTTNLALLVSVMLSNRRLAAARRLARHSEMKLATILDNAGAHIFIKDTAYRYQYVNDRTSQLFRVKPEAIVGRDDDAFFDAETAARLREIDRRVIEDGERLELVEDALVTLDGETRSFLVVKLPLRDEGGQIYALCGIATDITERVEADKAGRELSERLSKIASRLSGVVYQYKLRTDGRSCFPYASDGIRDIYRVSPEDVREDASCVFALLHPEDHAGVAASILNSARTLSPWKQDYRVRFADGSVHWLLGNATPEREADGSVLWHGFITDITERKAIEQALAREKVRYQFILKTATDGIHIIDRRGRLREASDSFYAMLGYRPGTALNIAAWEAQWSGEALHDKVAQLSRQRGVLETKYRRSSGDVIDVEITARGIEIDGETFIYVSSRDISERKRFERSLTESEWKYREQSRRFAEVIWGTNIGTWEWNLRTGETAFNDRWAEIVGYTLAEISPMTLNAWLDLVHPDDLAHSNALLQRCFSRESETYECEVRMRHKSGNWIWALDRGRVVEWAEDGTPLRMSGTHQDITARKIAEQELRRSNADLEQFAYAISHDLRQPLRMVSSYLQLLTEKVEPHLDAAGQTHWGFALEGARRMDQMLLSLLELSRFSRRSESLVQVSTRKALDEALAFLRPLVAESGASITIKGNWPELACHSDSLVRLLQNLIGNALKYRREDVAPDLEIRGSTVPGMFRFEVQDNGVGFDPDQTGRLFQVFSRLHSRARVEGTGVGLALCRRIVERQGGRIGAESAGEGLGSTFWFELPLRDPAN